MLQKTLQPILLALKLCLGARAYEQRTTATRLTPFIVLSFHHFDPLYALSTTIGLRSQLYLMFIAPDTPRSSVYSNQHFAYMINQTGYHPL